MDLESPIVLVRYRMKQGMSVSVCLSVCFCLMCSSITNTEVIETLSSKTKTRPGSLMRQTETFLDFIYEHTICVSR